MHRPSAEEFLQALLETLDDVPPDLARRFEEILKNHQGDRSQAIRQLFEELAGD
jgi:ATP/maltotriose-dependent transcriptional regulator MalT